MPDGHDQDDEDVVVDLVDDAAIAGSDPPLAVPADQFLATARSGSLGYHFDGSLLPAPRGGVHLAKLAYRGRGDLDAIRHVRPSRP
mgnify:CR=1 FL=1